MNGDKESEASDTVNCVPNHIDRTNPVDNAVPDGLYDVSLYPEFSWDEKAGATDYVILLREGATGSFDWIYRLGSTGCTFKPTTGATYLDTLDDSLAGTQEYVWLVWAINENNCGFAFSEASFTTTLSNHINRLVNQVVAKGRYRVCWYQKDEMDQPVDTGSYGIVMQIGVDFDTTIQIAISDTATSVPSPQCDTTFQGIIPKQYSMSVNDSLYAVGDTISIDYDISVYSNCLIDVIRIIE